MWVNEGYVASVNVGGARETGNRSHAVGHEVNTSVPYRGQRADSYWLSLGSRYIPFIDKVAMYLLVER
jgi:hypothetical protein